MSVGPIHNCGGDAIPDRPCARLRHVEPVQPACAPVRECERDRFEPVPFDKFLERQNREFHAAVERYHASRRPCEPTPPTASRPLKLAESIPTPPPAPSAKWPRIGDVTPTPPHPRSDRLRIVQQFQPPIRPGRVIDLLL